MDNLVFVIVAPCCFWQKRTTAFIGIYPAFCEVPSGVAGFVITIGWFASYSVAALGRNTHTPHLQEFIFYMVSNVSRDYKQLAMEK
jgi:hypothetical protein